MSDMEDQESIPAQRNVDQESISSVDLNSDTSSVRMDGNNNTNDSNVNNIREQMSTTTSNNNIENDMDYQDENFSLSNIQNNDEHITVNSNNNVESSDEVNENRSIHDNDKRSNEISNNLQEPAVSLSDIPSSGRTHTRTSSIISNTSNNNMKSTFHLAKVTLEKIQEE